MKERIARTAFALALTIGIVWVARWTIREVVTRNYTVRRDVERVSDPIERVEQKHLLSRMIPEELRINIAGLAVKRRATRLHEPYALAMELAESRAEGIGWERLDDENALTIQNFSGMERVYKTPEGSIVIRELRPIRGDDTLVEDYTIPAEMIPPNDENATPDELARRSARRIRDLMPESVKAVVVGSPLMTQLIERGGGAAFFVHTLSDMPVKNTVEAIDEAALKNGWVEDNFNGELEGVKMYRKDNLTFSCETIARMGSGGCDINYRFTDDEVFEFKKGTINNEN